MSNGFEFNFLRWSPRIVAIMWAFYLPVHEVFHAEFNTLEGVEGLFFFRSCIEDRLLRQFRMLYGRDHVGGHFCLPTY